MIALRRALRAALLAGALCAGAPAGRAHAADRASALDAPLAFAPLDTPLTVTGGFGEYRIGHFHAGFDFGTGGRVGQPVRAPLAGRLERVRASGVGYGRSLYLRTHDGRLIQFGHLDAFMAPVAAWVDSIQRATGQYEQDLWPEAARFAVRAGQRIAWTGQSGAGGPHLHFEIRRGDTAFQPERAGLGVRDDRAPTLVDLTLEPLDDSSYVAGHAAPVTIDLRAKPDTLRVLGRVRAVVGARDGAWRGVDRMVPWLTRLEWGDEWLECRMDSISWATDMSEGDYVYDAGRVRGEKGIVLWSPAGWRPKFIVTNAPPDREAGTLRVRAGDAPRVLRLSARDVSGHVRTREVVVAALDPRLVASERPTARRIDGAPCASDAFALSALPGRWLRVTFAETVPGGPQARVTLGVAGCPGFGRRVTASDPTVLVAVPDSARWIQPFLALDRADECSPLRGDSLMPLRPGTSAAGRPRLTPAALRERLGAGDWACTLPDDVTFDDAPLFLTSAGAASRPAPSAGLVPLASLGAVLPRSTPLRRAFTLHVPRGAVPARLPGRAGLYRDGTDGWELVAWTPRADGLGWDAETRRPGRFALFADTLAPRIAPRPTERSGLDDAAYPTWVLEAEVSEAGSGVNARGCYILVDDRRMPMEWDPEASVLRWRPLRPPAPGRHRVVIVATDRAGNERKTPVSITVR